MFEKIERLFFYTISLGKRKSFCKEVAKMIKLLYNTYSTKRNHTEKDMKQVEIYTDGACRGNPGHGGWGAILVYRGIERELSGGEALTTNNRMELIGAIEALSALKEPCEVELYSDSKYIIDSITKGWVYSWRKNNWIKSDKKPALNSDLWEKLLDLLDVHNVTFVWVKGHAGHPENERCDELAVMERDKAAAE